LGNLTGVQEAPEDADGQGEYNHTVLEELLTKPLSLPAITKSADANDPQGEDGGGKKNGDSQFASHMKAQKGSSKFAKEKTLKQQRQYLPAFASREDLLKIVRENQGTYSSLFVSLRALRLTRIIFRSVQLSL
jgi:pre-mRNA-splicing factor ATP-dependent RNA helicase DHX38/PRP16